MPWAFIAWHWSHSKGQTSFQFSPLFLYQVSDLMSCTTSPQTLDMINVEAKPTDCLTQGPVLTESASLAACLHRRTSDWRIFNWILFSHWYVWGHYASCSNNEYDQNPMQSCYHNLYEGLDSFLFLIFERKSACPDVRSGLLAWIYGLFWIRRNLVMSCLLKRSSGLDLKVDVSAVCKSQWGFNTPYIIPSTTNSHHLTQSVLV